MNKKTCSACKIDKPLSDFHNNKGSKDGLYSRCKACVREHDSRYYVKNRDKLRVQKAQWRADNPEYNSEYYLDNRDEIRNKQKGWRDKNKDIVSANSARWHRNNPDKVYLKKSKRRATEFNAIVHNVYLPTNKELAEFYGSACLVPGCESAVPTLDHVRPMSKGGKHGAWNMQPLCQSHNASKGNRRDTDYRSVIWLDTIEGLGVVTYHPYP